MISFTVHGKPITKGSMSTFGHICSTCEGRSAKTGIHCPECNGRGFKSWITDQKSRHLRQWERCIKTEARRHFVRPWTGPIQVSLAFGLKRGKTVKRPYPTAKNKDDLDKLVRAVLDALTGIAYEDDGQVARIIAQKVYGPQGVGIAIREIDEQPDISVEL